MNTTTISDCNNWFGPLSADIRTRINAFLRNPTEQGWNDVYSIILNIRPGSGLGLTFWKAWLAVDPKAPTSRASGGRWDRIPDQFTAYRAIRYAATGER